MIDGQQREGLDQLRLDGRRAYHHHRLPGEHRGPLRDGEDIAGKAEVTQIVQKLLAEQVPPTEIGDILLAEMQVFDIVDQLLQTGCDGIAAFIGHLAEEHIEIGNAILVPVAEVSVAHGQLIKVAQHGHVQLFSSIHFLLNLKFSIIPARGVKYHIIIAQF